MYRKQHAFAFPAPSSFSSHRPLRFRDSANSEAAPMVFFREMFSFRFPPRFGIRQLIQGISSTQFDNHFRRRVPTPR
jgi:hypothetical protein